MAPQKCSYVNCDNITTKDVSLFRFPVKYPDSLKTWLTNCGNWTIAHMTNERLQNKYICSEHFDEKYIKRGPGPRTKLIHKKQAVPRHYREDFSLDASSDPSQVHDAYTSRLEVLTPHKVYKRPQSFKQIDTPRKQSSMTEISSTQCRKKQKLENIYMCRICLANDVGMQVLFDKYLRIMYKDLTKTSFATHDKRPLLICYVCLARLRNCYKLKKRCIESEKFYAQILKNNALPKKEENRSRTNGLKKTPVLLLDIGAMTEKIPECDVKEEAPETEEMAEEDFEEHKLFDTDFGFLTHSPQECYVELEVTKTEPDDDIDLDFENSIHERPSSPHEESFDSVSELESTAATSEKSNWISKKLVFLDNDISDNDSAFKAPKTKTINEELHNKSIEHTFDKCKKLDKCEKLLFEYNDISDNDIADIAPKTKNINDKLHNKSIEHNFDKSKKLYNCEQCTNGFSTSSNLQRHIRRVHIGVKKYKCDICEKCYSSKSDLKTHTAVHTSHVKLYQCNVCDKRFSYKHQLRTHILYGHPVETYQCDVCTRIFTNKGGLIRHVSSMHSGNEIQTDKVSDKLYICDLCEKGFATKGRLISHIRAHTGQKPYECNVCKNTFGEKATLNNHILVHNDEKSFQCDVCKKRYKRKHHLQQHYRSHTGEKPYQCNVCKQSFKQIAHLSVHTRIHTGKKQNHMCSVCGNCFTFKSSLNRHIIRAHNIAQ